MPGLWNSLAFLRMVKENDGRRNRHVVKLALCWFGTVQVGFLFLYMLIRAEEGPPEHKLLRVPSRGEIDIAAGKSHINKERAILEANYFLIDLDTTHMQPHPSGASMSYMGVLATFCPIDWHLQKENPGNVPLFRDLVHGSSRCNDQHKVTYDLAQIVGKIRRHDEAYDENALGEVHHHASNALVHHLVPRGAVFHESRCDSSLVSNLLSAQDPITNRVYSESNALLQALVACPSHSTNRIDNSNCNPQMAQTLLRDTLYVMNRSSDKRERNVYYRMQSVATHHLQLFTQTFPTIPWIFVYGDGAEIISSHLSGEEEQDPTMHARASRDTEHSGVLLQDAMCLRTRQHPPTTVQELVERATGGKKPEALTSAEYCAAHLASLCEAALREYDASNRGIFVNSNALPGVVWEYIIPVHFGVSPIHSHQVDRMKHAAKAYRGSEKTSHPLAGAADSSEHIQDAAKLFLDAPSRRMNRLSQEFLAESRS